MGLTEGEGGRKKRSDRLHVIAPFSRDSRGSRLAPTSFIWYSRTTSGLCVNPRKIHHPPIPLSPFTNQIESEIESPAIPGCRWSWSGFNTLRGSPCSRDTRLFHSRRDLGTVGDRGYSVLFQNRKKNVVLFGSAGRRRANHAKYTRYGICICREPRWNCCR